MNALATTGIATESTTTEVSTTSYETTTADVSTTTNTEANTTIEFTTETTTLLQLTDDFVYNPAESFVLTLNFFDADTGETVSGVNGRIEKWTFEDPDTHFSAFDEHETEVIQEFETTDGKYELPEIETDRRFNCAYMVIVDELPQDYLNAENNSKSFQKMFDIDASDITVSFPLKYSPVPESYPLESTYLSTIHFVDQYAYEDVDLDLECVLFNVDTGEELAAWNTSEYSEMTVELQYYFETHIAPDKYRYAVRVLNFSENTGFTYTAEDLGSNEMYINTISRDSTDEDVIIDNPIRVNIPGKEPPECESEPVLTITGTYATTTTTTPVTTTTTVAINVTEPVTKQTTATSGVTEGELPQTGYSKIYDIIAAIASAMTLTGAIMIKKKDI